MLPYNVRMIKVRLPQINTRNQVSLDMTVGAMEPGPVIQFMKSLEASPFLGPRRCTRLCLLLRTSLYTDIRSAWTMPKSSKPQASRKKGATRASW